MCKQVFSSIIRSYEPKTLSIIEPFYYSGWHIFQFIFPKIQKKLLQPLYSVFFIVLTFAEGSPPKGDWAA
jgi:hypothetical protein